MTTTVYDLESKKVASDTRWSIRTELSDGHEYIIYVDDCLFEKIADRESAVMVLAGQGNLIAQWKDWWYNSLDESNIPPVQDEKGVTAVSLMIIDKVTNSVLFDAGQKKALFCKFTSKMLSVFAGSGDLYAATCWDANRCSLTAVVSASKADYFTGPVTKYVSFESGESNLTGTCYDYKEIVEAILRGGYVMDLSKRPAANDVGVPLNTHQIQTEITDLIASGRVVASAPVPGLSSFEWNEEHKTKFTKAIQKVKQLEGIK
ncbi:hypothetical protein JK628_13170 [Shewanella sp. KX20019]|uniref:hypothetical protein n=1 Tax=Shewanella sp. KX20019 TaxID=2803864 RepID=UPI0019290996|nr:hypothetical protein [Shewanella sp. KX20019]QQX78532.1 hypothetical protein JK628_13170 [Shewanella sp. KX20019]